MIFSCCIPAKDKNDPKLEDLIRSIRLQHFDQSQVEIIVETRGDSESAKAMAIRQAKGSIIGMFCVDNLLTDLRTFKAVQYEINHGADAVYPSKYYYKKDDNSLNRYFSLIGGNDPVCYYLGKNDRRPHVEALTITSDYQPSYGCNGFFYRADRIKETNLDHYYPMDNASDMIKKGHDNFVALGSYEVWHRTSERLIEFLKRRYRYARDLYCERTDRRWKMVDTREDHWRLGIFILSTLGVIPCLATSIRGFLKIRDYAWLWHWLVCVGFLITYGVLACRNLLKHRSLFQRSSVPLASRSV